MRDLNKSEFESWIDSILDDNTVDAPVFPLSELAAILENKVTKLKKALEADATITIKAVPTGVGSWQRMTHFIDGFEASREQIAMITCNKMAYEAAVDGICIAMIITLDQILRAFESHFDEYGKLDSIGLNSYQNRWVQLIRASGNYIRHFSEWRELYSKHIPPLERVDDLLSSVAISKKKKEQISSNVRILVDGGLDFCKVMTKVTTYELVQITKIDSYEETISKFWDWLRLRLKYI